MSSSRIARNSAFSSRMSALTSKSSVSMGSPCGRAALSGNMPARPGEIDDLSFTCDPTSRASSAETLATRASNLSAGN
eukprot:scaffold377417_cov24-Attheya_sp.AAC.1